MSLDAAGWLSTVPIRLPDTIVVEERLPPGSAAVLINQMHTFTDLVLPIDALEHRIYRAIDGASSVAEIAGAVGADDADLSHRLTDFMRKLWWYDQIAVNASGDVGEEVIV